MNSFSDDILEALPDGKIPRYLEICKSNLSHALRAHHFLTIQHRWKIFRKISQKITPKCRNTIYVPKHNNLNNCTFIALTDEACGSDYCIFAFTLEDNCKELTDCFRWTKRIKWELGPLVESLEAEHVEPFKKVLCELGLELNEESCEKCYCLWLTKEKALSLTYTIPPDVRIDLLEESHAEYIHSLWPYEFENSCEYIRSMIILNGGLGVFDICYNYLYSWIITNDNLAPGCLQTINRAKRHGFAKLLLKIWCKKFAEDENIDIVCFIECDNDISVKLFESIGFEVYKSCSWLRVRAA